MSPGLQTLVRHVDQVLVRQSQPLYLVLDDALRLREWDGDGTHYGLPPLHVGLALGDSLALLDTLDPTPGSGQSWQFVELPGVTPCHVHVIRLATGWGVALLDAGSEHAERQARQQAAHEMLLLRRERETLLAKLEQGNRLKGEFIARMSHEFRTPLSSVIGYSDQLRETRPQDAEVQRCLDAVGRGARYLLNLVENLLDEARIEIDALDLNPGACELQELSDEVEQLLRPLARRKQLSLAWWFAGEVPPRVWLDSTRLKQVLVNLVGNAIKFTVQGGVNVEFDWREDRLRVSVVDTGPGISEADTAKIFEPFRQARDSVQRKGAGLGLSISQALVRAMGGEIQLSTREGEGSRFAFSIDAPAVRGGRAATPGALVDKGIVLADDDPDLQDLFRLYLSSAGCRVSTTRDAAGTLAAVRRLRPDVLLLDLNLGPDRGAEVAAALQTLPDRPKIVVLSADLPGAESDAHLAAQIDARWTKPISRAELLEGLEELLAD